MVRFDRESSEDINTESQRKIISTFKTIVDDYEVILLSDYGKGVLTNQLTQSLISNAKNSTREF